MQVGDAVRLKAAGFFSPIMRVVSMRCLPSTPESDVTCEWINPHGRTEAHFCGLGDLEPVQLSQPPGGAYMPGDEVVVKGESIVFIVTSVKVYTDPFYQDVFCCPKGILRGTRYFCSEKLSLVRRAAALAPVTDTLNAGDKVRLKSGGPKMTVLQQGHCDNYRCVYFVNGDYRNIEVPANVLEKV